MPIGFKKTREAMISGQILMVTMPDNKRIDSKPVYGLIPSGKQVSEASYRKIRENIEPNGDGLFGDELSQTFKWKD